MSNLGRMMAGGNRGGRDDAEDLAEELNRAYELGRKSAAKKPAKRRK